MADDEDGPEVISAEASGLAVAAHGTGTDQEDIVADEDEWVTTVARTSLGSDHIGQKTSNEDSPSSTQSFRQSQGLVRCSIKESESGIAVPQKRRKSRKEKAKAPRTTKSQTSSVVVAITQLSKLVNSPSIDRPRNQPCDQEVAHGTQSSAVPESG